MRENNIVVEGLEKDLTSFKHVEKKLLLLLFFLFLPGQAKVLRIILKSARRTQFASLH